MHLGSGKRQIRPISVSFGVAVFILACSSVAGANQFGLREWEGGLVFGNITSIAVPTSSAQPPNAGADYSHRSLVIDAAGNAQIQAGFITLGSNIGLDNCGTTNSLTYAFMEAITTSGTIICHFFGQYTVPSDINFNVYQNSSGWNDKINGVPDPSNPYTMGFSGGFGEIGGESYVLAGVTAKSSTCYGNGPSAWRYYTSLNDGGSGALLVTPNSETSTILTGGWSIGPAPTPLCDSIG
jgi:hypothetical protein